MSWAGVVANCKGPGLVLEFRYMGFAYSLCGITAGNIVRGNQADLPFSILFISTSDKIDMDMEKQTAHF